MNLLDVVILYYPDSIVQKNIQSYLNNIDQLIVWDNTPEQKRTYFPEFDNKIIQMGVGENLGIGSPLNEAIKYAQSNGYTHLLTMDQDSSFEEQTFCKYKKLVEDNHSEEIAAYCVNYSGKVSVNNTEPLEINICITSGTIHPISIFNEIGLFREDFFIDSIDTEFCLRALKCSKRILYYPSIHMSHQLGYHTYYKFLWGRLGTPNYSAFRTYYILRNLILLKRMYKSSPDDYIEKSLRELFCKRFVRICLVEKDKFNKVKCFIKAIIDGLTMPISHAKKLIT